jgi:hypothetical protein
MFPWKERRSWGTIALSAWLIVMGLTQAAGLSFSAMPLVLGALAIAAGVLILMGR